MIETKRNIFDDREDLGGESASEIPIEVTERINNGSERLSLKDVKSEKISGFLRDHKQVGIQISHVPGEVRIFVAKHKYSIVAGVAAVSGAIYIVEKNRRKRNEK